MSHFFHKFDISDDIVNFMLFPINPFLDRKNKVDAFQYKGNGFGATYNGKIPNLRIDYILLPENTDVFKFKIFKEDLSDHYPQMATVRFK